MNMQSGFIKFQGTLGNKGEDEKQVGQNERTLKKDIRDIKENMFLRYSSVEGIFSQGCLKL